MKKSAKQINRMRDTGTKQKIGGGFFCPACQLPNNNMEISY